jgi:glutamate synthase domain-containing protein 3
MITFDLAQQPVRDLNQRLHQQPQGDWSILHPGGRHCIAVGVDAPVDLEIHGHVGYYCGGMNKQAHITIKGSAGPGVAENMMSGSVRVRGNVSHCAGASGHGGLLIVEGDASARCGISLKGSDIVVTGSIGHLSAFMAQSGRLVVCGDAGDYLGDSIYEAVIYLGGKVNTLGADCIEKEMTAEHLQILTGLLSAARVDADPGSFRRFGSARKLYNFNIDHASDY